MFRYILLLLLFVHIEENVVAFCDEYELDHNPIELTQTSFLKSEREILLVCNYNDPNVYVVEWYINYESIASAYDSKFHVDTSEVDFEYDGFFDRRRRNHTLVVFYLAGTYSDLDGKTSICRSIVVPGCIVKEGSVTMKFYGEFCVCFEYILLSTKEKKI